MLPPGWNRDRSDEFAADRSLPVGHRVQVPGAGGEVERAVADCNLLLGPDSGTIAVGTEEQIAVGDGTLYFTTGAGDLYAVTDG